MAVEPVTFDPTVVPGTRASYWTVPRAELEAWIRRYAPSLADLYVAAVVLLHDSPVPGCVLLISHAVREICNRLPGRVSGVEGDGRLDYASHLDEIAEAWTRAGLEIEATIPLEPGPGPSDVTPVVTLDVS